MSSLPTLPQRVRAAFGWIAAFSTPYGGISVSSRDTAPYPEVTGYYIPTLMNWGMRDIARGYAAWLCSIQKSDGSWRDPSDSAPYVFDTGQILKGLLCLTDEMPEFESAVLKGCDWIVGNIDKGGRLCTPTQASWGKTGICSELVHLYCLSPLIEAGKKFRRNIYIDGAGQALSYYKTARIDDILDFNILSHFYAYVIEGLIDVGERELAGQAMDRVSLLQKKDGSIPAYERCEWVCSTGLFQFALIYYKLGMKERGDKAFRYAVSLQNASGGWFGGYPRNKFLARFWKKYRPDYFPQEEISWAVKYFLDAFQYKLITDFEHIAPIFLDEIATSDGRYQLVKKTIEEKGAHRILDAGCGKGRYLRNLLREVPNLELHGVDLSLAVMQSIPPEISRKQGSLLNLPYPDGSFDLVFSCEALEHAVHTDAALAECARVVGNDGSLLIIDKSRERLGALRIAEWEQGFDIAEVAGKLSALGCDVEIFDNVPYENKNDGFFCAWLAHKVK
jgi:malonyl-CoA O-methyltransferase